jgi:hypothetical protein
MARHFQLLLVLLGLRPRQSFAKGRRYVVSDKEYVQYDGLAARRSRERASFSFSAVVYCSETRITTPRPLHIILNVDSDH